MANKDVNVADNKATSVEIAGSIFAVKPKKFVKNKNSIDAIKDGRITQHGDLSADRKPIVFDDQTLVEIDNLPFTTSKPIGKGGANMRVYIAHNKVSFYVRTNKTNASVDISVKADHLKLWDVLTTGSLTQSSKIKKGSNPAIKTTLVDIATARKFWGLSISPKFVRVDHLANLKPCKDKTWMVEINGIGKDRKTILDLMRHVNDLVVDATKPTTLVR